MNEFDKIMQEAENEGLKVNQGLSRLLLDMWKNAKEDLRKSIETSRRLFVVSVISSLLAIACLCGCLYLGSIVHRQSGEIAAIQKTIESGIVIEETTTTTETTTQTAEGDTATINNGTFEQYNGGVD